MEDLHVAQFTLAGNDICAIDAPETLPDAPVAAVCDAAPADAKHCVELEAKELDVRADPDGVRRRVVVLRDALVRGAALNLREEAAAGGQPPGKRIKRD